MLQLLEDQVGLFSSRKTYLMLRGRFQVKVFDSSTRPSIMVLFHFWLSQYAKLLLNSSWYHFKKVSFFNIILQNSLGSVKGKKYRQNDFQCKKNKEPTAACCFHEIFFLVKLFVVVLFLTIFESHCSWRKNWHHISFHNFVAGSYCYFF